MKKFIYITLLAIVLIGVLFFISLPSATGVNSAQKLADKTNEIFPLASAKKTSKIDAKQSQEDNQEGSQDEEDFKQPIPIGSQVVTHTASAYEKNSGIALGFIIDYARYEFEGVDIEKELNDWANKNELVTQNFRASLAKLLRDAYSKDPDYGLGSDPIIDAQDIVAKGFFIYQAGKDLVLIGNEYFADMRIPVKFVQVGDKWLIDGAGIVNIDDSK